MRALPDRRGVGVSEMGVGTVKKELGRISDVYFGLGGYQEAMIGIHLQFSFDCCGVGDSKCAWDANCIKWSKSCEWSEKDRSAQYDEIVRFVSDLLSQAKVDDVAKLKGKPVELTFDGMSLKSWRILTEVL